MQWWCSAQGIAWSWHWRPYPGVWLFMLLLLALYLLALRHTNTARRQESGPAPGDGRGRESVPPLDAARRRESVPPRGSDRSRSLGEGSALDDGLRSGWRRVAGWAGLLLAWVALDWPVGTLGAGYLSSVHSSQFLLLTFIAPPLILLGLGPLPAQGGRREGAAVFRILGAAVLFNIVVIASHAPRVLDALMPTQLGAFAFDIAWVGAGLLFWQPVLLTRHPIHPLARMGYIFWGTLAHTGIGVVFLLARYPLYRTYELAPPIPGMDPMSDQQLAGGIMELVGMLIIFGAVSLVAFRWMSRENALERESRARLAKES